MGSGGTNDNLLKNAKSLGNSLGTANKKSINMSNNDKMLAGIGMVGIDRDQSTLNEGQFYFRLLFYFFVFPIFYLSTIICFCLQD